MAKTAPKADWGTAELASTEPNYRLVWRSWGREKTGKSHLGASAPGPVAIHAMDVLGVEGMIEKFAREKEVRVFKYHFDKTEQNAQTRAADVRDAFLENIQISLRNARTVQVDETEIWEVFRYAEFGEKSDSPNNYDKLYADYREWIHEFDHHAINLQLIQKVKEKWENVETVDRNGMKKTKGRPTGQMEPTGYKGAQFIVQANIEHSWDSENGFGIRIDNCRQNMSIAGNTYHNLSFVELAQLVFPKSSESDWLS